MNAYMHTVIEFACSCLSCSSCVILGPGPTGGAGQQVVSATQPCPLPIPSVPTHSQEQTGGECVCIVKPVYTDHSRDQVIVVAVDRWSLYGGTSVQVKWTMSQSTVVYIDRWSSYVSGL